MRISDWSSDVCSSDLILAYGTEAQKQRWLPAMAHGDRIGAIAMTEPGAGSDLQAIRTSGRRVAGGFRLSGQKTFISNGQTATLVALVARTEPEHGARARKTAGEGKRGSVRLDTGGRRIITK